MVNRCLGIEEKFTHKLRKYKTLVNTVKEIQDENESDGKFMPRLDDSIEKNQLMKIINCKDHLNKELEGRSNIFKRKVIKENKGGKRRVKQIIQEAKCSRE
jgi:inorganic pyrophosphatase